MLLFCDQFRPKSRSMWDYFVRLPKHQYIQSPSPLDRWRHCQGVFRTFEYMMPENSCPRSPLPLLSHLSSIPIYFMSHFNSGSYRLHPIPLCIGLPLRRRKGGARRHERGGGVRGKVGAIATSRFGRPKVYYIPYVHFRLLKRYIQQERRKLKFDGINKIKFVLENKWQGTIICL